MIGYILWILFFFGAVFSAITGMLGSSNSWLFAHDLPFWAKCLFFIPGALVMIWISLILLENAGVKNQMVFRVMLIVQLLALALLLAIASTTS